MDEDIGLVVALGQEAEASQAVEPFDCRRFKPARGDNLHMGARQGQFGWMQGGRFVQRDNPEGLQPAGTLHSLDYDPRALVGDLVAVPAQARDMEKNVGQTIVGQDETEALGDIEPLDAAAYLNDIQGRICIAILRDLATVVILRSILTEIE
jgi:hypothetical protein